MNIEAYAKAKAEAINEIGRKTGIDLSAEAMPMRPPNPQILELFRLQKIARELPELSDDSDAENLVDIREILSILSDTEGIGPVIYKRIESALLGE